MTIYNSPLRYPGGKGKIAKLFHAIVEDNELFDGTYIEPYAGGASVALSLLFNEYVSNIIINDYDRSIYAFWRSVLTNNDEFCKRIDKTKVNIKTWEECKRIQRGKKTANIFDLGYSTFFLNRTNRSGIINGGIIGGKKQDGKWKIDARFNKEDLICRIKRIGEYGDRIKVHNLDAIQLLQKMRSLHTEKTLIYFDPPYYKKGKKLYVNFYNDDDHLKISKLVQAIKKVKWIISYDNRDEIKRLYKGCYQIKYDLNYSATGPSKGSEIMFFSKGLNISVAARSILNKYNKLVLPNQC